MEERTKVYLNVNSECGGAGNMKDVEPRIIVHDQGIRFQRFRAVGAAFREALNPCSETVFVVDDEHLLVLLSSELLAGRDLPHWKV